MDIWVYCFWNRHIIKGSKTLIKDYPTKWGKIIINIGIFNVMIFLIIFYYNSIFDIHTEAQLQRSHCALASGAGWASEMEKPSM